MEGIKLLCSLKRRHVDRRTMPRIPVSIQSDWNWVMIFFFKALFLSSTKEPTLNNWNNCCFFSFRKKLGRKDLNFRLHAFVSKFWIINRGSHCTAQLNMTKSYFAFQMQKWLRNMLNSLNNCFVFVCRSLHVVWKQLLVPLSPTSSWWNGSVQVTCQNCSSVSCRSSIFFARDKIQLLSSEIQGENSLTPMWC